MNPPFVSPAEKIEILVIISGFDQHLYISLQFIIVILQYKLFKSWHPVSQKNIGFQIIFYAEEFQIPVDTRSNYFKTVAQSRIVQNG